MKVLITGGYGFIGSYTAERFYKEGYQVYIIDNLTSGTKDRVQCKHKSYKLDVDDSKCEGIFDNHNFDIVVHLACDEGEEELNHKPLQQGKNHLSGLINMLHLSSKYGVKKFIFISSTKVYGEKEEILVVEDTPVQPDSLYGINKFCGENYCRIWKEQQGLDTIALRVSHVYGPNENKSTPSLIGACIKTGLSSIENPYIQRDFIYVEDVVDAIYKASVYNISHILNITSYKNTSLNKLTSLMKKYKNNEIYKWESNELKEYSSYKISNERAIKELNWLPKYSLEEGIQKTCSQLKNSSIKEEKESSPEPSQKLKNSPALLGKIKNLLPFIENIIIFMLAFYLSTYAAKHQLNFSIDFYLISIIIISILYGLKQGVIAVFLSSSLLILESIQNGHDLIAIFYNVNLLVNVCLYIFVGAALGYFVDSRNMLLEQKNVELDEINEKLTFLHHLYSENKQMTKKLEDQIISSKDSFGKIHRITSTLDTLDPDKVFGAAVHILEELLDVKEVAIFAVSQNGQYLRLLSNSKDSELLVPKSISIDEHAKINKIIVNKEIYVNKQMDKNMPMLMAPIIVEGNVISLIAIYNIDFQSLSLYKQNLFSVVSSLITSSLARAYQYEQAIQKEKYMEGSSVLKYEYFKQVLVNKREEYHTNNANYVLLKLYSDRKQHQLTDIITRNIREFDYMGTNKDGELLLLLTNTEMQEAQYVIRRLQGLGVETQVIEAGGRKRVG